MHAQPQTLDQSTQGLFDKRPALFEYEHLLAVPQPQFERLFGQRVHAGQAQHTIGIWIAQHCAQFGIGSAHRNHASGCIHGRPIVWRGLQAATHLAELAM